MDVSEEMQMQVIHSVAKMTQALRADGEEKSRSPGTIRVPDQREQ